MRNEALTLYIREVLGTEVPAPQAVVDVAPVVVATEELTEFSQNLLHKILASVGLVHYRHQNLDQAPLPSRHRLEFSGGTCARQMQGEFVQWSMPSLSEMLGDGPEVANRKRAVWSLLKEFQREFQST